MEQGGVSQAERMSPPRAFDNHKIDPDKADYLLPALEICSHPSAWKRHVG